MLISYCCLPSLSGQKMQVISVNRGAYRVVPVTDCKDRLIKETD